MMKKIIILSFWISIMIGICIHQYTYVSVISNFTQECGQEVLKDVMAVIHDKHTSVIYTPYLLQLHINYHQEDLVESNILKPGTYQGSVQSPYQSYLFTYTVIDTTPPKLSLDQTTFTLLEGEPFDIDLILPYLHMTEFSAIQSLKIKSNQMYFEVGIHDLCLEVIDAYQNKSEINFKLIVKAKEPSEISIPSTPNIYQKPTSSNPNYDNLCSNGNPKINPAKSCHEPAYDEYPHKIGSLEELQAYALTLHKSHFITNITLNDGSEAYGLWLTE